MNFMVCELYFNETIRKKKGRKERKKEKMSDCSKPLFCLKAQPRPRCQPSDPRRLSQTQAQQSARHQPLPPGAAGKFWGF